MHFSCTKNCPNLKKNCSGREALSSEPLPRGISIYFIYWAAHTAKTFGLIILATGAHSRSATCVISIEWHTSGVEASIFHVSLAQYFLLFYWRKGVKSHCSAVWQKQTDPVSVPLFPWGCKTIPNKVHRSIDQRVILWPAIWQWQQLLQCIANLSLPWPGLDHEIA